MTRQFLYLYDRESQQGAVEENSTGDERANEAEDEGRPSADEIESDEGMQED